MGQDKKNTIKLKERFNMIRINSFKKNETVRDPKNFLLRLFSIVNRAGAKKDSSN
jgi:hypothetical protein